MKLHDKLIIITFLCLITAPSVLWFFISPNIEHVNIENRRLKDFPVLNSITLKQFPKDFEAFYADRLPFRTALISLYGNLQYQIIKEAESPKTLFAKDGWLFYKSPEDGDHISDYKKINLFKTEELEKITRNLLNLQSYLKKINCEFIFIICPNKENIYYEYMPDSIIRKKGASRTEQLLEHLQKHTSITAVYPYKALIEAKKIRFLYYKTDIHWNAVGGYIAAKELLKIQGIRVKDIDELSINYKARTGDAAKAGYDLANLTGARNVLEEPYEYALNGVEKTEYNLINSAEGIALYSSSSPVLGKMMIVHDSFANMMIPILAPYYKESLCVIYYKFTQDMISRENPDVFIYETTERYLPELLKYNFTEGKL